MKKLILVGAFVLAGCNTMGSVNGDDYLTAIPQQPKHEMIGIWAGAIGPYLNTIKINSDGTGINCYSWNDKNVISKLVYDGKNIIMQSGEKLEVNSFDSKEMYTTANYYMTAKYKFYKDDDLNKSSLFCSTNIK